MSTGLLLQLDAQKGQISGSIQDSSSGEVIPFATVALYQDGEAAPYRGAVSDEQGGFDFSGSYYYGKRTEGRSAFYVYDNFYGDEEKKSHRGNSAG